MTPAYKQPFSQQQMEELVTALTQVIPPLSVWQRGQLCVALPFVSAALSQGAGVLLEQAEGSNMLDTLQSLAPYLVDCALTSDFDARARSAAASCLYQLTTKFQKPDAVECLSKSVLSDIVMPAIIESAVNLKTASNVMAKKALVDLCEAFDVAAILVSIINVKRYFLLTVLSLTVLLSPGFQHTGNCCCLPWQVII